jgi:hypothetical protein
MRFRLALENWLKLQRSGADKGSSRMQVVDRIRTSDSGARRPYLLLIGIFSHGHKQQPLAF